MVPSPKWCLGLLFFLGISFFAHGQLGFDIWVGDLRFDEKTFSIEGAKNITNRPGYDNQPYFIDSATKFLYTSDQGGEGTDIYLFDLLKNNFKPITNTAESEFSPQFLPGERKFSTVRIDGDEAQRFWFLDEKGAELKTPFELENVGYNCWLNNDEVFFFLVGAEEDGGHQLAWGQVSSGKMKLLDKGIGRSLSADGKTFYYTKSLPDQAFQVISLLGEGKPGKFEKQEVTNLPKGTEDIALFKGRYFLTVVDNKLLAFDLKSQSRGWQEQGVAVPENSNEISRMVIDEQAMKIALIIAE